MARINCEHCGSSISDKAPFCPKCGLLRVKAVSEDSVKQPYCVCYPKRREPLKTPKGLWAMGIIGFLILAGGIVCLVLGVHNRHQQYLAELEYQRQELLRYEEQQRLEAILLQEEQERLDSIRQDSLNKNFVTFDLSFHQLHGKVKDVKWDNGWNEKKIYKYDEEGNWINDGWTKTEKQYIAPFAMSILPKQKTIRDSEGKIIKVFFSCCDGEDFCYDSYSWNDGKIIDDSNGTYSYNKDGTLAKYDEVHHKYEAILQPKIIYYSDYKFDHYGNWIERTMKIETWDDDSGTPEFIDREIKKEKRTITYY